MNHLLFLFHPYFLNYVLIWRIGKISRVGNVCYQLYMMKSGMAKLKFLIVVIGGNRGDFI